MPARALDAALNTAVSSSTFANAAVVSNDRDGSQRCDIEAIVSQAVLCENPQFASRT